MWRNALIALMVLVSGTAYTQDNVPVGWITDYDYEESLTLYLERQYRAAIERQLVPYVYLYGDWCPPCVAFRNRVHNDASFAKLFTGTQIVALELDEPLLYMEDTPESLKVGVPLIIPIESNGTLGEVSLNGIPWRRIPQDIEKRLCEFFGARTLPGVKVDRGCPAEAP